MPLGRPGRHRRVVVGDRVVREGPRGRDRAADRPQREQQRPPQAERDEHEPAAETDRAGDQRAARVGQHQDGDQHRDRGDGEPSEPAAHARARTGPQAGGQAERGHQSGRVPVRERHAQAAHRIAGVERGREHLGEQRVPAGHHGHGPDGPHERRPAGRGEPGQRHRGAERGQVGERAVRLHPRIGRLHGPRDRGVRQRGERRKQGHRDRAPGASAGAEQDDGQAAAGADRDQRDLDPGVRGQLGAAGGSEHNQPEAGGKSDRDDQIGGQTQAASAARGHLSGRLGRPARGRRGESRHAARVAMHRRFG